jgi:hypothetical protein
MFESSRQSSTPFCDAAVDQLVIGETQVIRALVKITYAIREGRTATITPLPLRHDYRLDGHESLLAATCDFSHPKAQAEVWVRGKALTLGGIPQASMNVRVEIGRRPLTLKISGEREAEIEDDGSVKFYPPKPFTEVPLEWTRAYGGIDHAALAIDEADEMAMALEIDHPGRYPRNPLGVGFRQTTAPNTRFSLPQIEDASDALTPQRLAELIEMPWWKHPRPILLEPMPFACFPRSSAFHIVPLRMPQNLDEIPEIASGELLRAEIAADVADVESPVSDEEEQIEPRNLQGVHPLLVVPSAPKALAGIRFAITGMHRALPEVAFNMPSAPRLQLFDGGRALQGQTRIATIEIFPNDEVFTVVYEVLAPTLRPIIASIATGVDIGVKLNGAIVGYFGN